MPVFITVPGFSGSGEAHWQSIWEQADPSITRFAPASWDHPSLADWIEALDRAITRSSEAPILVAHSLGCLLIAHWTARAACPKVAGAFLVAVPDPDRDGFPAEAQSFHHVPMSSLPFPSVIVASVDDPFASIDHGRACAEAWRSKLIIAGTLGHMNTSSGHGLWAQGRALLDDFAAGLGGSGLSAEVELSTSRGASR